MFEPLEQAKYTYAVIAFCLRLEELLYCQLILRTDLYNLFETSFCAHTVVCYLSSKCPIANTAFKELPHSSPLLSTVIISPFVRFGTYRIVRKEKQFVSIKPT